MKACSDAIFRREVERVVHAQTRVGCMLHSLRMTKRATRTTTTTKMDVDDDDDDDDDGTVRAKREKTRETKENGGKHFS